MIISAERSARVEAYVREHCFAASATMSRGGLGFGAEMELLAVDAASGRIAPIDATDRSCSLDVARAAAARLGWTACRSAKGVPRFVAPEGGALTFEPGGQVEYASAVHRSITGLLRELRVVDDVLRDEAAARGIDLLAVGVDPENGAEEAPLQLRASRYRRMAAYFAGIGADGARMMRQTASLQVCLGGIDVEARYRLANAVAPWLVALFANSPRYAGDDTGCASYRAHTWRGVDPARTGLMAGSDPVREYAAFAMRAPAFLAGAEESPALPFACVDDAVATDEALATHLSTLFPEVRPRGYLELRSMDAIGVEHHAAAVVFATGLLADDRAAAEAGEVAREPDTARLRAAGRVGLGDSVLAAQARTLADVALAGCARLGAQVVDPSVLEHARDSFDALLSRAPREPAVLAVPADR
jgi:glutamate--cysteine ligase